MSRRRVTRLAWQVLVVLGCAAVGFLVRTAVQEDPSTAARAPVRAGAVPSVPTPFRVADVQTRKIPRGATLIATAKRAKVWVRPRPGRGTPRLLRRRVIERQPVRLTFMVVGQRPGWVRVQLPARPNRSTGWVRRADVRLSSTRLRVRISLRKHRLELLDGDRVRLRAKVGLGTAVSPTPKGRYFITDVIRTRDPGGFYGPYSLGLSAYSPVLTSFRGGDGQIGLHGTDAPETLGTDVSAGCIRVSNRVVRRLAALMPLGAPVSIGS